jgi:hypothetical protein
MDVETSVNFTVNLELPTFSGAGQAGIAICMFNTSESLLYKTNITIDESGNLDNPVLNDQYGALFLTEKNLLTGVTTLLSNAINTPGTGPGAGGTFPIVPNTSAQFEVTNIGNNELLMAVYINGNFYAQTKIDASGWADKKLKPTISFVNSTGSDRVITIDNVEIKKNNNTKGVVFEPKVILGEVNTGNSFPVATDGVKGQILVDKNGIIWTFGD